MLKTYCHDHYVLIHIIVNVWTLPLLSVRYNTLTMIYLCFIWNGSYHSLEIHFRANFQVMSGGCNAICRLLKVLYFQVFFNTQWVLCFIETILARIILLNSLEVVVFCWEQHELYLVVLEFISVKTKWFTTFSHLIKLHRPFLKSAMFTLSRSGRKIRN